MQRAMIITIGTGREVENGISYSIQRLNPDKICFICSEKSKPTIDKVLNIIDVPKKELLIKEFNEINDVERLFDKYIQIIDEVLALGFKNSDVTIDFTSGTKAMSSALVAAAIFKQINDISYVYGERGPDGRVMSGTERINILSPIAIFTNQKINLFKRFFNEYQYENALAVFNDKIIHFKYKSDINLLSKLAHAYSLWDKFQFEKSLNIFKEIQEIKNEKYIKEATLKGNIKLLKGLSSKDAPFNIKGEFLIKELWSNAKRRFKENKFDDAVARLYRLLELIGQVEIYKSFKVLTKEFPYSKIPKSLQLQFEKRVEEKGNLAIALFDTYEILAAHNNNLGSIWKENQLDIKKVLSFRNQSILAHGLTPVSKEHYLKFELLVSKFIKNPTAINNFPKFEI